VTADARPDRYRLYVDESGDHTYKLLDDSSRRYLALLGVWFRQHDDYVAFADALEALKREIFGPRPDEPVVLHRSDIINRRSAFGVLRDNEKAGAFDAGLLQAISSASFRMVCVIIDKQGHQDRYAAPFHPYHYCMAAMLERYSGWLNYKNAVGDVMAEARGREEDLQLAQAYTRVYESGTMASSHQLHQRVLTSKDIKIRDKRANIAGLQLAVGAPSQAGMPGGARARVGGRGAFWAGCMCSGARQVQLPQRNGSGRRLREGMAVHPMKRPPDGGLFHADPYGSSTCELSH